ncbi:hypothetical protein CSAL01_11853 [Colletotrichum salicis]|uniref:Tyrosinase copper-binding domain-containing protein n=1 Tax=Colletotrichum salicis TaxID=1209931 RepID=A0A135TPQ3_9PEZI|nr:hypothetical protein CSAL01_11853 [Colletotrichum salicis]
MRSFASLVLAAVSIAGVQQHGVAAVPTNGTHTGCCKNPLGPFLPWHRWMLYLYESELRNKCSYNGALLYWDVSLDNTAETFVNSPVFDNVYGIGGNGPYIEDVSDKDEFPVQKPITIPGRSGGGYSVTSTPHCLRRDFSLPIVTSALIDEVINKTLSADSFFEFNLAIQGYSMQVSGMTLNAGLHIGIGGAVGDVSRRD